ncbi:DsbA family protein [Egicoccus halophilus]|uniref:DSBA oxidoreductase n=1 Tax=Egicoccus halophilus TaxID=1670830 RepID=A0A8J3AB50_9ACTN|nr:DsbA family protein [Egicoccus halophilus]GGI02617.1 DSBA oxidoreductase [Egicoccus halophilus]
MAADVEFFFDPVCPFCWQTSRWIEEVRRHRPIEVRWRPISLWFLNEDSEDPDSPLGRLHHTGLDLLRVIVAAEQDAGARFVGPLYTAISSRIFEADPPDEDGFDAVCHAVADRGVDVEAALREVRLAESLAEVSPADADRFDTVLRQNTEEALARAGEDVGTPVLSFSPPDGPAFFGPVISRVPEGEQAVELYDAVVTLARYESFAELKRELRRVPELPLLGRA